MTAPYTPKHNGILEMKNWTLVNMMRRMLKQKQKPHYLWGEAAASATYLNNRSPTMKMNNKTLEEAWSGVKPSVQHLRVFVSLCFRHIPDQMRRKLDDKSQAMILVGYHSTGAYKIYDPKSKKVVFNKDVKFDESKSWHLKGKALDKTDNQFYMFDLEIVEHELENQEDNTIVTNERGAQRPTRNTQPLMG
jgi:hypothetical protein